MHVFCMIKLVLTVIYRFRNAVPSYQKHQAGASPFLKVSKSPMQLSTPYFAKTGRSQVCSGSSSQARFLVSSKSVCSRLIGVLDPICLDMS